MLNNIGLPGIIFLLIIVAPLILGAIFMGFQKKIRVTHTASGVTKFWFVGYCWTYFIFGFFVPIFRGEIGIGLLHLVFSVITFGIFQLVMPFLYNKQFTTRLLTSGWSLSDVEEMNAIARQKLNITEV